MIEWKQCKAGATSIPTGESAGLRFCGIFTISKPGDWKLSLQSNKFSYSWMFGSKKRCEEFAEALVEGYGLHEQVKGTVNPRSDDLTKVMFWKQLREMSKKGFTPDMRPMLDKITMTEMTP